MNQFSTRSLASTPQRTTVCSVPAACGRSLVPCPLPAGLRSTFSYFPVRGQTLPSPFQPWDDSRTSTQRIVPARLITCAAGDGEAYTDEDFVRVSLVEGEYGGVKQLPSHDGMPTFHGVLVFKREGDTVSEDTQVLEVFVAGESALSIRSQLQGSIGPTGGRPTAHDLLWQVMQQAPASSAKVGLQRVAIVDLHNDVFMGRLYFGDANGRTMWDIDCRPSDGCCLYLKSRCPFVVSKHVWAKAATPLRDSTVHKLVLLEQQHQQHRQESASFGGTLMRQQQTQQKQQKQKQQQTGQEVLTAVMGGNKGQAAMVLEYARVRPDDPEAIKLLKSKLVVLLHEEDYRSAAAIRDHPWMRLYKNAVEARTAGNATQAMQLERKLQHMIEGNIERQDA